MINQTSRCLPFHHHFAASAAILTIAASLVAHTARAQVQTYEGFDYPGNIGATVSGQNGGIGWSAAWATGGGPFIATNTAGSLTYSDGTGHSLLTDPDGVKLTVGSPTANGTAATPNRTMLTGTGVNFGSLAAANTNEAGTLWISFLYQRLGPDTGAPFFRQANFGLFAGTAERFDVGGPNTSASIQNNLSLWSNGGAHPSGTPLQSSTSVLSAGAQLIVLKLVIDTTTAADSAFAWFNPADLTAAFGTGSADLSAASEIDMSAVTNIRFQAGNFNANGTNALFNVDELRVGYTVADVLPVAVPEPSSLALLGLFGGVMGALAAARKNRNRS